MPQTGSQAPVSPERILQTGLAFWASKTLLSAVELELFTRLAEKPSTARRSARSASGCIQRAALDFFDALVALGFLHAHRRRLRETPRDRTCSSTSGSRRMSAASSRWRTSACSGSGTISPKDCAAASRRTKSRPAAVSPFAELYADPARLRNFLAAMTGISHGANMTIAAKFPWRQYKTFVDAGTAQGDLAVQVARANPHLKGTGLDLPVVQPIFEEYAAKNGVARSRHVRGGRLLQRSAAEAPTS